MCFESPVKQVVASFDREFPSLRAIYLYLWSVLGDPGCRCGEREYRESKDGRCRRCIHRCGLTRSVTAGTFLHGLRKVRPRLLSLWLKISCLNLNANQLKQVLEVSYDTAWIGEHALRSTNLARLSETTADQVAFLEIIGRRTVQTPALKQPSMEVFDRIASHASSRELSEENEVVVTVGSPVEHGSDVDERAAEETLCGTAVWSQEMDSIACNDNETGDRVTSDCLVVEASDSLEPETSGLVLTLFESKENGAVGESAGMPAGTSPGTSPSLGAICAAIATTFQFVSVKYLQLYVAHWLFFVKQTGTFGEVLKEVLACRPFGVRDVRRYSSCIEIRLLELWRFAVP